MPWVPVAAAVLGVAGSAYSAVQQQKASKSAAKANRRAREAQQKIQDIQEKRKRVQMIREARIRRARLLNAAVTDAGVGTGSTAAQGGLSSIQSQLAGNIATSQQVQGLGDYASNQLQQGADAQSSAATGIAVGNIAAGIGAQFGDFKPLANLFDSIE